MIDVFTVAHNACSAVTPDETVALQMSTGWKNESGELTPTYAGARLVAAHFQPVKDNYYLPETILREKITRTAYINCDGLPRPVAGADRPDGLGGDLITRRSGDRWLVIEIKETFNENLPAHWVAALCVKQMDRDNNV